MTQEIARMTGIQVVDGFRYLGVLLRASYQGSMRESYDSVCEGVTAKCNRIYASNVDLFHRRQLIKSVVIPSYNHVFVSVGPCWVACKKLDLEIIKLFWTHKANWEIKKGWRLVAKKRVQASYEMGGLKMNLSTDMANGLMLNGLQRIRQGGLLDVGQRTFMYQLLEERLREINIINLEELFKIGGPKIWIKIGTT
jgi:hypothetical protein